MALAGASPVCGYKRREVDMNHTRYEDYRKSWYIYKGLLGLNLILLKFLLVFVRLSLALH